jgi:hypothetical protein
MWQAAPCSQGPALETAAKLPRACLADSRRILRSDVILQVPDRLLLP